MKKNRGQNTKLKADLYVYVARLHNKKKHTHKHESGKREKRYRVNGPNVIDYRQKKQ